MTRTKLVLAFSVMLVLSGRASVASDCRLLWAVGIGGDTLSLELNRFPERRLKFPTEWLPIGRCVWGDASGHISAECGAALIQVLSDGQLRSQQLQFFALERLCRNQPVFREAEKDSISPADFGFPTISFCPVEQTRYWWYTSPDTSHVLVSAKGLSRIYDRRTCETVRSDFVMTRYLRQSARNDQFAAFQVVMPGTSNFLGRVVLMKWTGELLWASPWLNQEHDHLLLFPDGSTVYYAVDYKNLVCRCAQDSIPRVLDQVPFGETRLAANGSRLLVMVQGPKHDAVVIYNVERPSNPEEVSRRKWEGYFVTDAAISASGARFAVTLQRPPGAPGPHCSLVIFDSAGDNLSTDLADVNPPITFLDEFLFVGLSTERDRPIQGQSRGVVQVYSCE